MDSYYGFISYHTTIPPYHHNTVPTTKNKEPSILDCFRS